LLLPIASRALVVPHGKHGAVRKPVHDPVVRTRHGMQSSMEQVEQAMVWH
jgi:hypothetical protein